MNRLSTNIAASALGLLLLAGAAANAEKKPKNKKAYDLGANPLAGVNSKQPDKELYDKAMLAIKKGHFDVARLDLQTMLNTYPESEYRMRAKLAVGDSWFKEGGSAALTQAESEYHDFITFFPNAPEAAEAQMKVADIYFSQMEKPDRDFKNAQDAEREYRAMINQFPDSTLVPRAKQKLREVQEVLAERESNIGLYYETRENYNAAIARLQTVVDTYPLYSKSDQALLGIGDAYEGQARSIQAATKMPGAIRERMRAVYLDKAAAAYDKVITRYPMAPHVEDARDRLLAMNRPVPDPTQEAVAENDAEVRSQAPMRFTDKTLGLIKHGPTVVSAAHVGEPTLDDPKRTLAPEMTKANLALYTEAVNAGKPAAPIDAATPTGPNEPPRTDSPSTAPLQTAPPSGGNSIGAEIISAPAADPNAVIKPVGPSTAVVPAAEKPAEAPDQVNEVKPGSTPAASATDSKKKKPKVDSDDESSSKKKKKKGLSKINPF
jgi:outer membrane protein assembly factor BamD